MKKIISSILLLCMCLSFLSCKQKPQGVQEETKKETVVETQEETQGETQEEVTENNIYLENDYQVAAPLVYPDYTFTQTPGTDELRQMAVKAMADMLSVQWCVDRFFSYNKTSTGSGKDYNFIPQNTYGGMPYTNADGSIVQWFEFYDQNTGRLLIEGDTQQINDCVGNTCAGCVCAAWQTVCTSISGYFGTGDMVVRNGFIPVGGYESPDYIAGFNQYSTQQILEDNGRDVMFACYAQVLPADALVSTPDVHAVMAIEAAYVVYKADGSIDPDASYITIQDQRNGQGQGFYNVDINGQTVFCNGRLSHQYTFNQLWDLGYIPVTTAEFLGTKEYEAPQVAFDGDTSKKGGIAQGYITSNYPICVAKMVLVDEDGKETLVERILLDKRDVVGGTALRFPVAQFLTSTNSQQFMQLMEEGKNYKLRYVVSVSNAQCFIPLEVTVAE